MGVEKKHLRVGVLYGGRSGEHEVSLRSARSVMAAMDDERYTIVPIGIAKDGRWYMADGFASIDGGEAAAVAGREVALLPVPGIGGVMAVDAAPGGGAGEVVPLDVIFPVLHGPFGEDGTVQGVLEMANMPYVGAGVLGSSAAMDKEIMKHLFLRHGLPVLKYATFLRRRWEQQPDSVLDAIEEEFRYPVFVKPANMGSSVGISKASDRPGLAAAMDEAARYDRKIVVEQGLEHPRELEVSVLGNDDPRASVVGEIKPGAEFYDYEAKYIADTSELVIPADLDEGTAETVRRMAVEAFQAVDCAGLGRVDFLASRDMEEIYVNEINTLPGFTSISMYPKLWEASGLPYHRLIDELIGLAFDRWRERQKSRTDFPMPGN